ncbi:MAG: PD40 domain-containing protein, partial [Chlorobia bacterium]|nr:PD40 domain-containing protein [Fimbriimonadaceae bacterium]
TTTGSTTGTTGSSPFSFYYASDAGGTEKGYRVSSDGTGRTPINTGSNAVSQITVNRTGTKLAFVVWTTYKHIYVVNPDGSGSFQITNDDWDTGSPCFSPDGSKILYTSYEDGTPQLWTMNVDGTGKVALTNFPDGALQGRYSPNGQKIVYVSSSVGDDVWIMNANGTSPTALASSAEDENEPVFNADGSKVVFVKIFDNSGDAAGQIMIVASTGGSATRLTTDLQDDREPVVSQDGLNILFTRPFGVGRDVFKMSLTGTGQTRITNEAALSVSPSSGN